MTPAEDNGNNLLKYCQDALTFTSAPEGSPATPIEAPVEAGYCFGIVDGIVHMHDFLNAVEKGATHRTPVFASLFCVLENVTTAQGVRVVVKYLQDNPAKLHQSRVSLIVDAFHQAFPCKKR